MSDRERAALDAVDGLYLGLGEAAPALEGDAATIALYESSREVGAAALAWRERLDAGPATPRAAVAGTLAEAARLDPSGRLALAAMTSLVGPRVLVTLRDLREEGDLDEAARAASSVASDAVVAAIWRCARAAERLGPGDPAGAEGFAALARRLEAEGFGESFT